jgi:hypothetical protein
MCINDGANGCAEAADAQDKIATIAQASTAAG